MRIGFFVIGGSSRPREVVEPDTVGFVLEDPPSDQMLGSTRTPVDVLWVDHAVLHDDIRIIHQWRVTRPLTRILVGHDPHLTPPDAMLAQVTALGIYDLVPEGIPLSAALAHPQTFADAARWHTIATGPGSTDPFLSPAASRRSLWHKQLMGSGERPETRGPQSLRIVRPRRLLMIGSHGGVGTSSLVVALAKAWAGIGVSVAVVDAARHGGWLPLAWHQAPLEAGWDRGLTPEAAWYRVSDQTYLLAQSGLSRSAEPGPDQVRRLHAAFAHSPVPSDAAWIIDGGANPAWCGALQDFIDGTVLVTSATPTGQYAGARQHTILAAGGPPLWGLIINRHRGQQPTARDIARSWDGTALAEIPEHPEAWDAFWEKGMAPGVTDALAPVAQRLLESSGPLSRTKGWVLS